MLPQFRKLRLLLHVRDQAEVDLRFRDRGVHGLRALLDVPTHEAANRASGGIDQAPEQLEIAPAADEFGDAPELFEGLRLEGARAQVPQLAGARAPRVRVPAGDLDSTLRVAQRHERVDQSPRRVRRDCRVRGVLVHLRGAAGHLDVEDAFASELDLRRALVEVIAAVDRRALRAQDLLVRVHEGGEMRAPDLFLPLDDELQIDGRPPFDGLPRLDREELHDQVAFRVRAAATPEFAVLDRGIERVSLPFVQRVDRLDVVMLVHQQRRLPFVDDHLAEDDVRAALRRDLTGLEAVLGEEPSHEGGRLRLRTLVGRDRRESDVFLEDFEGLLRISLDAGQDIRQGYAPHPRRVSRRPIRTRRVASAATQRTKGISPRTVVGSPGVTMEFLKGVHVIETYATTTLLVDDRLVLVDTSADADAGKVLDYLSRIKVKPKDLSTIFITHTHPDHVGGLAAIKHSSPAKVASSRVEAEFIARKRVYDGPPGIQRHPGTVVDVPPADGQVHDGLRMIFTPGHTRGSMSLLDESRSFCIAGDAANNESGLRPTPDQSHVDPTQHRESIKKLAKSHFENVVMGHGTPIKGGASAKIAELAKRL